MICILHGYLLEGSGSNLWTRAIAQALSRQGQTVHVVCQENHPEHYDFISEAYLYPLDGAVRQTLKRAVPYSGRVILHKPELGNVLPVYVRDRYDEFSEVVPMIELSDAAIERYVQRNFDVVSRVVRQAGITVMHANHAVLMSVVAQRVSEETNVPFAVMPHGSAIEYAVKKDERFLRMANQALAAAGRILVIGPEIRSRVGEVHAELGPLDHKMTELNLGVDTTLFQTISEDHRQASINDLVAGLATAPRGKTSHQSARLLDRLPQIEGPAEFTREVGLSNDYDAKRPDTNLEAKLAHIDWRNDKTILFVGRLIANKGIQALIAAMPRILAAVPDARLIVVGHGPLREVMESFVWALQEGRQDWVERFVRWGSLLEEPLVPFVELQQFFDKLASDGETDEYWESARQVTTDRVVFTGYLNHDALRHLFPCCDVAVFPSLIPEAGPLVFYESLASGCFPLGTYFAGMAANIDAVASLLPELADLMKLRQDPAWVTRDISTKVPQALAVPPESREALRRFAEQRYDWSSVAKKLAETLYGLAARVP